MKNKIKRFERKWQFKSNNFLVLLNSLIRSKLFFRTQYPLRKVNSIYFDTHDYVSIRENLDGVSNKKKIRLRWYGKLNIINNPSIEIKSKKGFETKKESISIKELNNISFPTLENLKNITDKINIILKTKKPIYPILTTHYEREYLISLNGKIRATVDFNLKSIFLNNFSQIDIIKNFKNICILELKYPTSSDMYVREKLKDITLRLSKNSKFVNSAFDKPRSFS
jgi:SPX domain protein involved in polyphosphate accumulation